MPVMDHSEKPTNVVYSFLKETVKLIEKHQADRIVFCFDTKENKRCKMDCRYKSGRKKKRKELDEDQKQKQRGLFQQIDGLRKKHLKRAGFRNIFFQDGYEADDLIATTVKSIKKTDEAIIVSADHDLYQLLNDNVSIWNTRTKITLASFHLEYGIIPSRFGKLKAIAGCSSDDVQGIVGVGEKTAAAYLRGELKPGSKALELINAGKKRIKANRRLVELPLQGTEIYKIRKDRVTQKKWQSLMSQLGMQSIMKKTPTRTGKKIKT